jgi:DNA topoisomerase IB
VLVAVYPHERDLLIGEEFLKALQAHKLERVKEADRVEAGMAKHFREVPAGEYPLTGWISHTGKLYDMDSSRHHLGSHEQMAHLAMHGEHKESLRVASSTRQDATKHLFEHGFVRHVGYDNDDDEPAAVHEMSHRASHPAIARAHKIARHVVEHQWEMHGPRDTDHGSKPAVMMAKWRQHQQQGETQPLGKALRAESEADRAKEADRLEQDFSRHFKKVPAHKAHGVTGFISHTGNVYDIDSSHVCPGYHEQAAHLVVTGKNDPKKANVSTERGCKSCHHLYRHGFVAQTTDGFGDPDDATMVGHRLSHHATNAAVSTAAKIGREGVSKHGLEHNWDIYDPDAHKSVDSGSDSSRMVERWRGASSTSKPSGPSVAQIRNNPHFQSPVEKGLPGRATVHAHTSHSKTGKVERVQQYERGYKPAAPKVQTVTTVRPKREKIPAGSPHPLRPDEWKPSQAEHREAVKQQDPHKFVPPSSWNLRVRSLGHEPDQGKWTPGLLATYRDRFGDKQPVYSKAQRALKDAAKFEKVRGMSKDLPKLRRQWTKDLATDGLTRNRVAAAILRLCELTTMRIGEEKGATKDAGEATFGAASLRKEHVTLGRGKVTLSFAGKHHKEWDRSVTDKSVVQVIEELMKLPGDRLWQYQEGAGTLQMTADRVRDYMASLGPYTPKDLRTYQATKLAAESLTDVPVPTDPPKGKKDPAEAVIMEHLKKVADRLGNTPGVCKSSYVNPEVLETWKAGKLKPEFWKALYPEHQSDDEAAFARLLDHIAGLIKRGEIPNLTGGTIEKAGFNLGARREFGTCPGCNTPMQATGCPGCGYTPGVEKAITDHVHPWAGRITESLHKSPGAVNPTDTHKIIEKHGRFQGYIAPDGSLAGGGVEQHGNFARHADFARTALKDVGHPAAHSGDDGRALDAMGRMGFARVHITPASYIVEHQHITPSQYATIKKLAREHNDKGFVADIGNGRGSQTAHFGKYRRMMDGVEKAMPRSDDAVEWQMHRPDTQYRGGTRHREHLQALAENQRVMDRLLKKHGSEAAMSRLARLQYHALAKDSDTHRYHISHLPHPPPDSAEEKWLTSRRAVRKAVGEETGEEEPDWKHSFEDGMDHDTHIRTHEKEWMDLRRELVRAVLDKSPAGKEKRAEIIRKMRECSLHRNDHLLHKHGLGSQGPKPAIRPAMKAVITVRQGGSHE